MNEVQTKNLNGAAQDAQIAPVRSGGPLAVIDPAALIQMAIERSADVNQIERLVDLFNRIRAENAERAFSDALAKAQGEFPPVPKTRENRGKGKYANLDDMMEKCGPVLSANRLSATFEHKYFDNDNGATMAVSSALILRHGDGHKYAFQPVVMPVERITSNEGKQVTNGAQAIGSAMTYADRRAYQGGLGLRPCEEDDDGEASGSTQPPKRDSVMPKERAPSAPLPYETRTTEPVQGGTGEGDWVLTHPDDKPGWYLLEIERVTEKQLAKGPQFSAKILGRENSKWPSTFSKGHAQMLRDAVEARRPIWVRIEMNGEWPNIKDVQYPVARP